MRAGETSKQHNMNEYAAGSGRLEAALAHELVK